MDILSLLFLAAALAMDAFSAAVTDGIVFWCVSVSDALYRKFGVGVCD